MTSKLSGRQSPSPSRQTGAQETSPPGSGHIEHKFAPGPEYAPHSAENARREGESQTAGLTSNPVHPLEEIEAAKYRKGVGNYSINLA